MSRGAIFAGKAAILVTVQDQVDRGLVLIRNKLNRFANSMGAAGSQALRGGILGSIGSGFMLKQFADFSDEMLNLQAKLGYFGIMTNKQRANMEMLDKTIRRLGRSTSFTSKEVASAAVELAQAGFSVEEINDSLQATLDLARGAGYSISESASMMANAIRTFNLDTAQANTVVSQFVRATRLGTIGIEDLREALKYVSGTAYGLEQTLPVVLGLMVQMSESGLKGSLAGTSLNVAMLNMIGNLEKLQGAVKGFELRFDQKGAFDFVTTLQNLFDATKNLSNIERVKAFQDVFNIRGARAISSVQEIQRVEDFIKQIKTAGMEARLASRTMDSELGGAVRRATSAFDDLGKTIGRIVGPVFEGLLESVAPLAAHIDQLARRFPNLVLAITAMPFALVGAGAAMLTFSMIARRTAGVVGALLSLFRGAGNMAVMGTIMQMGALGFTRRARRGGRTSLGQLRGAATGTAAFAGRAGAGLQQAGTRGLNTARAVQAARAQRALDLSMAGGFDRRAAYAASRAQYARTVAGAMRARGVATPQEIAAYQARATRWASRATAAKANASALRSSAQAGSMFNIFRQLSSGMGAKAVRGMAGLGRGLAALARGFLTVSRGVLRFTFSFSGIWTIFELLLLFGNKIPFIAAGMERLGKGFSAAFGEIGRIGSLMSGPFKLLWESIGLLTEGNGENAALGFKGISTALSDMGSIIWNQIVAAWYQVVKAVAPFYDFIRKIVVSLYEIIKLIIQMGYEFVAGRFSAFGKIIDMAGGSGGLMGTGEWFVQGIGWFVKAVFDLLDGLGSIFDQFLFNFQQFMISMMDALPGTRDDSINLLRAEAAAIKGAQDVEAFKRARSREGSLKEFNNNIKAAFAHNTEALAKQGLNRAHAGSASAAQSSWNMLDQITREQGRFMQAQMAQQLAMQSAGMASTQMNGQRQALAQMQMQRMIANTITQAMVGYAHGTRGNLLKKGVTEKELLEKQAKSLENIEEDISELNERKGPLVFRK